MNEITHDSLKPLSVDVVLVLELEVGVPLGNKVFESMLLSFTSSIIN